jgi:hypothetical protein
MGDKSPQDKKKGRKQKSVRDEAEGKKKRDKQEEGRPDPLKKKAGASPA